MITVATCVNISEAIHLRMVLESAGIPVFVPDEATASVAPHHFGGGVRVQVPEDFVEEAQSIIAQDRRERQQPD